MFGFARTSRLAVDRLQLAGGAKEGVLYCNAASGSRRCSPETVEHPDQCSNIGPRMEPATERSLGRNGEPVREFRGIEQEVRSAMADVH